MLISEDSHMHYTKNSKKLYGELISPVRMVDVKKTTKWSWEYGQKGTPIHSWRVCTLVQAPWKSGWRFLSKPQLNLQCGTHGLQSLNSKDYSVSHQCSSTTAKLRNNLGVQQREWIHTTWYAQHTTWYAQTPDFFLYRMKLCCLQRSASYWR